VECRGEQGAKLRRKEDSIGRHRGERTTPEAGMRRLGCWYQCTTLKGNEGETTEVMDKREADGEGWKKDIPLSYLLANY